MLGDYPMASPERFKQAHLDYNETFGAIDPQTMRSVIGIGKTQQATEAMEQAVETGEPIRDWSPHVSSSPESSAAPV